MLYPQNGDRIVAVYFVMSSHSMYRGLTAGDTQKCPCLTMPHRTYVILAYYFSSILSQTHPEQRPINSYAQTYFIKSSNSQHDCKMNAPILINFFPVVQ